MSDYAPLVGFGDPDDPTAFARFRVEIQGNEDVYPDWDDGGALGSIRQIAGTNQFDVYHGGFGPSRLSLTVYFETRQAYLLLRRWSRTRHPATLSLLAQYTSHEGVIRTHLGREYEQYRSTIVERIVAPVNRIGGGVECTVVFLRAEGDE